MSIITIRAIYYKKRTNMYTESYKMLAALKKLDSRQFLVLKHHLDSLISVTSAVGSISCLDELLGKIVHYALEVTGAERGFQFLYSHDGKGLTLEIKRGAREDLLNETFSFTTYRVSREIIKVVENTGRALIGNQEASGRFQGVSDLTRYGVKQALCVPFQSRGKTLGFLYLDHSFNGELFREHELELLKSFAILTSLCIENAYLTHRLEGQRHEDISITIEKTHSLPNLSIIKIEGILDFITMGQLDKKCLPLIEHEAPDVIIDLSNLDYASKSGILCLIRYLIRITSMKGVLKFIRPPQHVYRTFEVVGLSKKIDMYDNIGEAVNTFH